MTSLALARGQPLTLNARNAPRLRRDEGLRCAAGAGAPRPATEATGGTCLVG